MLTYNILYYFIIYNIISQLANIFKGFYRIYCTGKDTYILHYMHAYQHYMHAYHSRVSYKVSMYEKKVGCIFFLGLLAV